MTVLKSDFLRLMHERGYIHQCTNLEGLDETLSQGMVTAYIGFDATASSLHVGNLLGIMVARWFQKLGHRPLILVGGGTTRVGDPSGKDQARKVLSEEEIQENIQNISRVFSRFISFGSEENGAILVNNASWLDQLSYIDFLSQYGRYFSINRMLTFESVRLRLEREQPLSFLEFNYMVLQGYDFLELFRRFHCRLQLGGSDQWGNIVNGIDLIRKIEQKESFGLTSPLLTTADGQKMGKSAQGAVWLNEDQLSPYDYWQFWRNTQDPDVGRFLRLYTELSLEEIKELESLEGADLNQAKVRLADEATRFLHGEESLESIHQAVEKAFHQKGSLVGGGDLPTVSVTERGAHVLVLVEALCALGFCDSKGEAKRLIQAGGARLNDQVISDIGYCLQEEDFLEGYAKISAGKKRHGIVSRG